MTIIIKEYASKGAFDFDLIMTFVCIIMMGVTALSISILWGAVPPIDWEIIISMSKIYPYLIITVSDIPSSDKLIWLKGDGVLGEEFKATESNCEKKKKCDE